MRAKFGATKFRNAIAGIPAREEWYRSALPAADAAPANTSSYSSVIKTNREWIVTLAPNGDCSVRAYNAPGESGKPAWSGKLGGVADWDISPLEDGGFVAAHTDGTATYYAINGDGKPEPLHTLNLPAKGVSVSVHPTTPGIVAIATTGPLVIYDVAAPDAAITLAVPKNIALWTVAWSRDGRHLAGLSKKGSVYVWDPRASAEPVKSRDLSTQLQALKPVHLVWAGDDLFITSFSRSRTRQYSLLTGDDLSTVFTASLDTSQGPLLPVVDAERRIVYAAGRGDMTLRHIELSGPEGYQEVLHPLPSALTSGLALAHWSTLPVMEAHIAYVLIPTQDKDGDCILPVQIKVPRRQLIDYHDDLYPDEVSSVPEQDAKEWLAGGDKRPLPVSLNPERRGEWERSVAAGKGKWSASNASAQSSTSAPAPSSATPAAADSTPSTTAKTEPLEGVTASLPAGVRGLPRPQVPSEDLEKVATPASLQPTSAGIVGVPASEVRLNGASESALSKEGVHSTKEGGDSKEGAASTKEGETPTPKEGETTSSTSYKVRIIADFLKKVKSGQASSADKAPLMVGLQGPQGCGKTTLCDALVGELRDRGLAAAVLSLDDLYRTHDGLKQLASKHPNNPLLSGRGPPGTHDVELATEVLNAVHNINKDNATVQLPIFDKSLCNGEGDRSSKTVAVKAPLDVFVLEGWSMGFSPLPPAALEKRIQAKDGKYFTQQSAESLTDLNNYLGEVADKIYPNFSALVQVEPDTYEHVFKWRLEQEHHMKEANGGRGMSDEQVRKFVERYMPEYELWAGTVDNADAPWAGRVLRLRYGKDREVLAVEQPQAGAVEKAAEESKLPKAGVASPAESKAAAPKAVESESFAAKDTTPTTASPSVNEAKKTEPEAPAKGPAKEPATAEAEKTATPKVVEAHEPFNPGWSRKYLSGRTPLNPTYDQVPPIATLHQDSSILRVTPNLALFPIQGPGGRVCVQPLSKKGRIPVGGWGYLSGGVGLADFAADPFGDRVVLAGEDGVLRVWEVGPSGIEGAGPEPSQVIKGDHIERIAQIAFHPTAKDLLLVASNEQGKAHLRFFDLSVGEEKKVVTLDTTGVTSFAIAPEGDRIALATKDQQVIVLDGDKQIAGKAHDSPRSAQITWAGKYLVSLGFSRGSMRKLNLYSVTDTISTIASVSLEVSPSVLFPHYDPDTSILYVWAKGQQVIVGYEINPDANEPIDKLPTFTGDSPQLAVAFLPKRLVDVKKVEVMKALRLTSRALEEVTFSIPRNKAQFFQDDIYIPTLNTSTPSTTAAKWLAGDRTPPHRISLQPEGLTPLSQAPKDTKVRTRFVPAASVMSEEERKKQEMDRLFAKAKADGDSSDDEPVRSGLPPPDDDW